MIGKWLLNNLALAVYFEKNSTTLKFSAIKLLKKSANDCWDINLIYY